jgi:hypothetical protein
MFLQQAEKKKSLPESSLPLSSVQRRHEQRVATTEPCEFSLTHALSPDHLILEEGSGMTVNSSRSGMQLLLGVGPHPGQLLEVHRGGALHRSVSLMEVCWAKPVREDVQGHLYLVGCRLTFDPTRYLAF